MTRILWLIAFLSVAAGVVQAQTADTRWRLRLHVFYDAGLEIEESQWTYSTKRDCDLAGGLKEIVFARREIMAPFECLPVHVILDLGKNIT